MLHQFQLQSQLNPPEKRPVNKERNKMFFPASDPEDGDVGQSVQHASKF